MTNAILFVKFKKINDKKLSFFLSTEGDKTRMTKWLRSTLAVFHCSDGCVAQNVETRLTE